jgi:hypothetical protein
MRSSNIAFKAEANFSEKMQPATGMLLAGTKIVDGVAVDDTQNLIGLVR